MELKLLPEDIDKFIKEAVIKSALGKNIETVIDKAVSDAVNSYNSPIKQLVTEVIREIIKEHLANPDHRQLITDAIVEKITPQTIKDMLDYGAAKLHDYVRDYNN